MRTKESLFLLVGAGALLSLSACVDDWGQQDPPAGIQNNVAKATLANIAFEVPEDLDALTLHAYEGADGTTLMPEVVTDADDTYGNVLHLNHGWLEMKNPYKGMYAENLAVAMTFFVKQVPQYDYTYDDAGEVVDSTEVKDYTARLFDWQSPNGVQTLCIDANGTLKMDGSLGQITLCDAVTERESGMLRPMGEWHWVALQLNHKGYDIWVDGYKRVSATPTVLDYGKLLECISGANTLSIGTGALCDMYLDNLTIYNSPLEDNHKKDPRVKNGGGEGGDDDGSFKVLDGDWMDEIGAEDCSTGWWAEFSPYFRIPANGALTLKFENHTSGGGNWNNWNLCLCTDAPRGDGSYAEYVVVRSDLYGWGGSYDSGVWANEGYGDWDAFRADMEGAQVTINVTRDGEKFVIDAVAVALNGNTYHETFTSTAGDGTQVIRAFLIVDGSHLKMDREGCSVTMPIAVTTETIGAEDCSTGWWAEFSDYFQIPANSALTLKFENHTSGGGNWNNWNLCLCTNADRGAGDYAEYVVVRSDLYGWGGSYDSGVWTNEGYGDWDAFRADMEGAQVTIVVTRDGENFVIDAVANCPNGNVYHETFSGKAGDGTQVIRAFLIVDGSHLKMDTEHCSLTSPI